MRTICIGDGTCQIADHRETGILHAHGGVVLGPFLATDSVLPTSLFKGFLPVVYTHDEVLAPLLGSCRVDVIDDGLLGFDEFATAHLLGILGILGLQTETGNHNLLAYTLLLVAELVETMCEVTYTLVKQTGHHGFLGQEHQADVQTEGHLAGVGRSGQRHAAAIICLY